jgi:hypothetical protein
VPRTYGQSPWSESQDKSNISSNYSPKIEQILVINNNNFILSGKFHTPLVKATKVAI